MNRPWQMSYLVGKGNEILDIKEYYIWWDDLWVSDGAARATRFNYEFYKQNAKPQNEILPEFEKYLYDDKFIKIAHNGFNFDIYVHNQWRKNNGLSSNWSYLHRLLDTDALARAWKIGVKSISPNEWPISMIKYGGYIQKGMRTNLTALGKEFNITDVDYNNLHNACEDVKLTFKVWNQLKFKIDI